MVKKQGDVHLRFRISAQNSVEKNSIDKQFWKRKFQLDNPKKRHTCIINKLPGCRQNDNPANKMKQYLIRVDLKNSINL